MDPINLNNMPHSPRSQIYFGYLMIDSCRKMRTKPVPQGGALIWCTL